MNLVMASVLLLAMLAFQPTLIYGTKKGLATAISHNNNRRNGKKHSLLSSSSSLSSSSGAKLMMAFESGDVLARSARGTSDTLAGAAAAPVAPSAAVGTTETNAAGGHQKNGSGNRRTKNSNNNKKLNKNSTPENSGSNSGRKHLDKKFSAAGSGAANHHQQQQQLRREKQHHGNNNGNDNKGGKQRELVKSQQHQIHGKRNGGKAKSESVEKTVDADKSQSTCRYAKSAWSECDAKTNMRSRTLTLKKGEANCLSTRTMQKKCKKTCRYEKGAWSECSNGQMTRQDKLKSAGSSTPAGDSNNCEALRSINKKCNPGGGAGKQPGGKANKERKIKDKALRRTPAPQQA